LSITSISPSRYSSRACISSGVIIFVRYSGAADRPNPESRAACRVAPGFRVRSLPPASRNDQMGFLGHFETAITGPSLLHPPLQGAGRSPREARRAGWGAPTRYLLSPSPDALTRVDLPPPGEVKRRTHGRQHAENQLVEAPFGRP